jgi:DNA-binding MarR family transcriptional regulator
MSDLTRHLEDPGQSGLFTRLSRVGLLLDAFQHRCLDGHGLRFVDFSVLRVLQLSGALSPSELAELTLRSTGGMTQIVDRLASAGLVGRTPDPTDRRRVVVGLTPKGRRLVDKAQATYAHERARLLGPLTDGELADVDIAVRRLLTLLSDDASAATTEEAAS